MATTAAIVMVVTPKRNCPVSPAAKIKKYIWGALLSVLAISSPRVMSVDPVRINTKEKTPRGKAEGLNT